MIRGGGISGEAMADARDVVAAVGRAGAGTADRFCAWAGRGPRRLVFTVLPLDGEVDLSALPLDGPGIALGVRREADGHRRVLWAVATGPGLSPAGLWAAAEVLAGEGDGELHLLPLPAGTVARGAALEDLGFPRLTPGVAAGLPRGRAYASARSSAATIQARSASSRPRSSMCA